MASANISWRLFIGCFLQSEALLAAYEDVFQTCAPLCRAKWVEPQNLHFTLFFLGDVPQSRVPGMLQHLAPLFHVYRSPLLVTGIGVFPHWHAPRVLFFRLENPDQQLQVVYKQFREVLSSLKLAPEERHPFVPHLTLARLKALPSPALFRERLSPYANKLFAQFESFQPVLVRSTLTRDGPVYSVLSAESPG